MKDRTLDTTMVVLVMIIGAIIGVLVSAIIVAVTRDGSADHVRDRQRNLTFHRLPEGVCVVVANGVHEVAITAVTCPTEAP